MRLLPVFFGSLLLIGGLLSGCSSDECTDNRNALPLAGFMNSAPNPSSMSLNSVTIYGLENPFDSILVENRSINEVYLPFRIDDKSSTFVFKYNALDSIDPGLCDTVIFRYDVKPMFTSAACGATYFFENVTASHTSEFIDSIRIPENTITNKNAQNIFIYFRTNQ